MAWEVPLANPNFSKMDVHIWRADLDLADSSVREFQGMLSLDERRRADRFHFERDKKRYIAGVGILRSILGRYLNVKPSELQFSYGEHGKPRLSNAFGNRIIHFNMSHSKGLALYGFSREHEIGVDVECVRDIPEMDQIVEEFFSSMEIEAFRSMTKTQRKEAFFIGWTRKEAFIKAVGGGLSQTLDRFEVSLVPGEPVRLVGIEDDSREASRWSIQGLKPAPNYEGAFAVKSHVFERKCWRWEVV
jgi:4'-phosphopantetheinyl transferase